MGTKAEDSTGAAPTSRDIEAEAAEHNNHEAASLGRTLSRITTNIGNRPKCFRNTFQEVSFVFHATMAVATNSFLIGATQVITSHIGNDLNMTQGQITWIVASTSLTAGAFQLPLGQLADLTGRKAMFLAGMGGFAVFALITGFSRNPFWMDILCGFLGLTSAMTVPPAIGIMGAAYSTPSKRKNIAFSCFSAGNPLGFAFGSLTSGVASRIFDWRASFFFLAMFFAVMAVWAYWAIPDVETFSRGPFRERLGALKQFDYVGTILTIFGIGLFSAGLTLGPDDGWTRPQVLVMIILGVFLLVLFVFWENAFPTPLMPLWIWKDKNFTFIILVVMFGFMAFSTAQFWLALLMQEIQRLEVLIVAVHLLPQVVAGLLWNIVAGHILHRVNNTLIMAVGAVTYVISAVLFSVMKADSVYWAFIFPALVLNVVGADFQFNVANMYVMQSLPPHQQSLAGGIFNTAIRLSGTVGLGISTAVYGSISRSQAGMDDHMLGFTRAFQACIAMAGISLLFVPFIRLGTQGNSPDAKKRGKYLN